MTEIKNLLFQPLTFHLSGDGRSIHLNPRERKTIPDYDVSPEMKSAAQRRFISISDVPETAVINLPARPQPEPTPSNTETTPDETGEEGSDTDKNTRRGKRRS